jgi:hypothetical protein
MMGAMRSKLLILLYPHRNAQASARIGAIRDDDKRQFQQQSVLRVDQATCASF